MNPAARDVARDLRQADPFPLLALPPFHASPYWARRANSVWLLANPERQMAKSIGVKDG
jgi:hypothetical protein